MINHKIGDTLYCKEEYSFFCKNVGYEILDIVEAGQHSSLKLNLNQEGIGFYWVTEEDYLSFFYEINDVRKIKLEQLDKKKLKFSSTIF